MFSQVFADTVLNTVFQVIVSNTAFDTKPKGTGDGVRIHLHSPADSEVNTAESIRHAHEISPESRTTA